MPTQPYYAEFNPEIVEPWLLRILEMNSKGLPKTGNKIRVPGVTTVLGKLGLNKTPLMIWAFNQGKRSGNPNDPMHGEWLYNIRDEEADVGTIAHAGCEADITGQEWDLDKLNLPPEMHAKVSNCMASWARWKDQSKLEVVKSEVPLTSQSWLTGGTLDCISLLDGIYGLLDLKSGKGPYEDQLAQIRTYGEMWNQLHPDKQIQEYHLLRIGKEDAAFHHHRWPVAALDWALELFKCARVQYELAKIGKRSI